jgi:hypothetical protein
MDDRLSGETGQWELMSLLNQNDSMGMLAVANDLRGTGDTIMNGAVYSPNMYSCNANAWITGSQPSSIKSFDSICYDPSRSVYWYVGHDSSYNMYFGYYTPSTDAYTVLSTSGVVLAAANYSIIGHPCTTYNTTFGNDDLIYMYQAYTSTYHGFYSYSVANNVWTQLNDNGQMSTSTPNTMIWYPSLSNTIIVNPGGSSTLWQYNISGNSWSTMSLTLPEASSSTTVFCPQGMSGTILYMFDSSSGDLWSIDLNAQTITEVSKNWINPPAYSAAGYNINPQNMCYVKKDKFQFLYMPINNSQYWLRYCI